MTVDNRGTDNGLILVKSGKNHTGRKRPTMAISLGFLIENFCVKVSSQVVYRDSHKNPYVSCLLSLALSLGRLCPVAIRYDILQHVR